MTVKASFAYAVLRFIVKNRLIFPYMRAIDRLLELAMETEIDYDKKAVIAWERK